MKEGCIGKRWELRKGYKGKWGGKGEGFEASLDVRGRKGRRDAGREGESQCEYIIKM